MSYLTRPSNVRVYQFRQPPLLRRRILPVPAPKDPPSVDGNHVSLWLLGTVGKSAR